MNFFNDKDTEPWTLFLDRDGVINRRIPGGYVTSVDELEILPGVMEAIAYFSKYFSRIIIVSNQQGVGKGIMTVDDVERVHAHLRKQIENTEGRVDGIYFCPALAKDNNPCRKPSTGMALQAQKDFPDIDLSRSVMAGDSVSDLHFAKNAGMTPVFIETEPKRNQNCEGLYEKKFSSLAAFSNYIQQH